MNRRVIVIIVLAWLLASTVSRAAESPDSLVRNGAELAKGFQSPPDSARPWVYCFWLDGNVTREGITADLEAMRRCGIGGALIMDGAMGNPKGPVRFLSGEWRALFRHTLAEANRLGLQINMNNDAGWAGSGGPWIKPDQASRRVVFSETTVEGPTRFDAVVARPPEAAGSYEDIALLAFPAPEPTAEGKLQRIADVKTAKTFDGAGDFCGVVTWPRVVPTTAAWPAVPSAGCVPAGRVQDLTGKMATDGRLTWDVPAGRWMIMRIGHTPTWRGTRMAQAEGAGLECNKLSKSALETHFNAMIGPLVSEAGPLVGKTLVATHIDSWEAGSGNWTTGFREEFRRRRGYDLLPYLPTLNGIIVDSLEVSERFLWDFRETVNDLLLENYADHMRELARQKGLRLTIEAYDGTCDDLRYAGRADEPMTEFWQGGIYGGLGMCDLTEVMTSAAHVYGKRIVGAEAYTSGGRNWLDHPATLKPLGDWALCQGVNRFCISEWAMQPWTNRWPGVCFDHYGTQYGRLLPWWEQSGAWHRYLARCQYLLRQGLFSADLCFLQPEGAPQRFVPPIPAPFREYPPERPEYNFDGCPAEVIMTRMTVKDGRLVLPDGMNYRLLVLPSYNADGKPVWQLNSGQYAYSARPLSRVETMTPGLLRKIKEMVEAGATVLGTRPLKSPSLSGFPACDQEVTQLADELWGKGAGASGEGERSVGKGRVVWGQTPEQVLRGMNVAPDFQCSKEQPGAFRAIHRRLDDGTDLYFVVNKMDEALSRVCSFRVTGKGPELWWPESGRRERPAVYDADPAGVCLPLHLEPNESVFVVFPAGRPFERNHFTGVARNGQTILSTDRQGETAAAGLPLVPRVNSGPYLAWWKTSAAGLPVELFQDEGGRVRAMVREAGTYELKRADGQTRAITVKELPAPLELTGPWDLQFQQDRGAPKQVMLDRLISWHLHGDAGVKYFSGEATYRKTFTLPAGALPPNRRLWLDLGCVRVMASVKVNGKDPVILWKAPFRMDITAAAVLGTNTLEVTVANLPVNRMIGDEQLPDDCDRRPNGTLETWPAWLTEGKPSPTGRYTFAPRRFFNRNSPLMESGLIGPVRILSEECMMVSE